MTAAFELFARDGYVNTSIEQICQTAYVGNKAFYELFDSKEDCYLALMNEIGVRIEARVEEELLHGAPDEAEEATVRRVLEVFAHELVVDPGLRSLRFGKAPESRRGLRRNGGPTVDGRRTLSSRSGAARPTLARASTTGRWL